MAESFNATCLFSPSYYPSNYQCRLIVLVVWLIVCCMVYRNPKLRDVRNGPSGARNEVLQARGQSV